MSFPYIGATPPEHTHKHESVTKMTDFGDVDAFRKMFSDSTGTPSLVDGEIHIKALGFDSIWQPIVGNTQDGIWTFHFSNFSNSFPSVGFYSTKEKAVYCNLYPNKDKKLNGTIRFTGRNGGNNWMPNKGGLGVDKDGLKWNPVGLTDVRDLNKDHGIRACVYKDFVHMSHIDSDGRPYRSIGYRDAKIGTILGSGVQGVAVQPNATAKTGKHVKIKSYSHQTVPRNGMKHVVFIGDSQVNMMSNWSGPTSGSPLYAAQQIMPNRSWPSECSKKLHECGYITSNTAIPGAQFYQIEAGAKGQVPSPSLGTIPLFNFDTLMHPEMENIVVLSAGVNGFIIGKKTVAQVISEFDALIDTVKNHASVNHVIVTTVAPIGTEWNTGWSKGEVNTRIRQLNDHIRNTAKTKGYQLFDLYSLVVDPANVEQPKPGWVGKDNLHYDQLAIDAIANSITPLILRESSASKSASKQSRSNAQSQQGAAKSESLWSGKLSSTGESHAIKLSRLPKSDRNLLLVSRAAMNNGTNEVFSSLTIPVNQLKANLTVPLQVFYPDARPNKATTGTMLSISDIWVRFKTNDTVYLALNQLRGWQVGELVEIVEIP